MTTLMKITTMKRMRMFLAMALGLALTANAGDLAIQAPFVSVLFCRPVACARGVGMVNLKP
jgi:hypothetical protein